MAHDWVVKRLRPRKGEPVLEIELHTVGGIYQKVYLHADRKDGRVGWDCVAPGEFDYMCNQIIANLISLKEINRQRHSEKMRKVSAEC